MLTTQQLAEAFAAELTAQGVALEDEAAFAVGFAGMLTGWLGGEDALPADTAYRLMQALGLWHTFSSGMVDFLTIPAAGGANGDGTVTIADPLGQTHVIDGLARLRQVTAKGDPGGISYDFSNATADADPGAGKLRFNHANPANVTKLFVDGTGSAGGDLTAWLAAMGFSSSVVKGLISVQAGSVAAPILYRVTAAPVAKAGYFEVPVAYLVGGAAPADGASLTVMFAGTGDKGDSVLSGAGEPAPGLGADGDVYLRLDTGDWYGPKAAGAWGPPIVQTEVASLLAQAVAAKNTAVGAESVAVGAAGVASDAAEAALGSQEAAGDSAEAAALDRQAVADDKAEMAAWLSQFGDDKDAVEAWLVQFAIDRPLAEAAAQTAITKAAEAAASAASVDGPLIAARFFYSRRRGA